MVLRFFPLASGFTHLDDAGGLLNRMRAKRLSTSALICDSGCAEAASTSSCNEPQLVVQVLDFLVVATTTMSAMGSRVI